MKHRWFIDLRTVVSALGKASILASRITSHCNKHTRTRHDGRGYVQELYSQGIVLSDLQRKTWSGDHLDPSKKTL